VIVEGPKPAEHILQPPRDLPPPGVKGTYALCFRLEQPLPLEVGRLGRVILPAGWLVYVGSALGPGGLRARVRRHLAPTKRPHWHIDALTLLHPPDYWLTLADGQPHECDWAKALAGHPWASIPAPGFGSSDCRQSCPAHLIHFPLSMPLATIRALLIEPTTAAKRRTK